ncbi:unnamed protein product, partial [Discosporangium mesarthrocarpum]
MGGSGSGDSASVGGRGKGRANLVHSPVRPPHRPNPVKTSILFGPDRGGRTLFGHINFDTTPGMIQMSRMGIQNMEFGRVDSMMAQRP